VLPSGALNFAAGETSKTITVNVAGDTTVEPDEGFTLTLSGATGATLAAPMATTVTIADNDSNVAFANATTAVAETTANLVIPVNRTGTVTGAASVHWSTADGTAVAGPPPPGDFVMRVLLVEDDAATAASIELMLKKESFIIDTTDLGEDGLEIGKLYDYDIIILDLMLPDIDGYEVLRRLRAARVRTPILILSGLAELDHKLKGLGFGADDFLTKPFDRRELLARIQAIVRRSKGHAASEIRTGKLTVSLDNRTVTAGERPLHLTAKEYGILELLSLRKGMTLTKEMFLNHLYGGMDEPDLKIIDVFICKLRKKLAQATGGDHYIETVWGRGYVLRDPEEMGAELRSA